MYPTGMMPPECLGFSLQGPILCSMKTEFYESDPFSPRKADLLIAIDTDYRIEKGDELVIENNGRNTKVRVMDVRVRITKGEMSREILALKL